MIYETDYLMHYNKNHDPRTGQFSKGKGVMGALKTAGRGLKKAAKYGYKKYKEYPEEAHRRELAKVKRQTEMLRARAEYDRVRGVQPNQNSTNRPSSTTNYTRKSKLSSEELKARIDRINLENNYKRLSKPGKAAVSQTLSNVGKDTAKTVLSTATTLMVGAYVAKKMGESDKFMKTFGLDSDKEYNKRMFERFTGLGKKK